MFVAPGWVCRVEIPHYKKGVFSWSGYSNRVEEDVVEGVSLATLGGTINIQYEEAGSSRRTCGMSTFLSMVCSMTGMCFATRVATRGVSPWIVFCTYVSYPDRLGAQLVSCMAMASGRCVWVLRYCVRAPRLRRYPLQFHCQIRVEITGAVGGECFLFCFLVFVFVLGLALRDVGLCRYSRDTGGFGSRSVVRVYSSRFTMIAFTVCVRVQREVRLCLRELDSVVC